MPMKPEEEVTLPPPAPTVKPPDWETFFRREIKAIENKLLNLEAAIKNTSDPEILEMLAEAISDRRARLRAIQEAAKPKKETTKDGNEKPGIFDDLI